MNDFYINIDEHSKYPSPEFFFGPDKMYPEYLWDKGTISKEKNEIYEMVRNCLIGLGLDKDNFGTPEWNPFSGIIKKNETVIIKPNWVFHENKNKGNVSLSIECLITHPSVVRAVIDYVLIALEGTGKVIVGDAPMLSCDLNKLFMVSGYNKLFEFYNQFSSNVKYKDFRNFYSISGFNGVTKKRIKNNTDYIEVDLGSLSKHYSTDKIDRKYKVSDYCSKETTNCHDGDCHKYLIAKEVLLSDVVINISKPKCHRLSGITAGLKNIVGITYDKACLPHRTIGSKQEGGDEYLNKSNIKKIIAQVQERQVFFTQKNLYLLSLMARFFYGGLYYLMKISSKDKYMVGGWYGNDTIWRTVFDLNYILLYADKEGNLQDKIQREVFNVADMVVSGEGDGPVSPSPKKTGLILAGYNTVMLDKIVCEIMGFNFKKVPGLEELIYSRKLSIKPIEEYKISSNKSEYENVTFDKIRFPAKWNFRPHNAWIGEIENSR